MPCKYPCLFASLLHSHEFIWTPPKAIKRAPPTNGKKIHFSNHGVTGSPGFGISVGILFHHRVGQEPFGPFPPSEPYVTVSRHTAQAPQSNLPFGIPGYLFIPWLLLPVTPLLGLRDLLADVVGRFFFSRSMLHPSDRRDWLRLGF